MKKPNKLTRAWISFWYNDRTRLLGVIFPSYFVLLVPALLALDLHHELLVDILAAVYVVIFAWALLDNDYSNLRRIGLDEYRQPLTHLEDEDLRHDAGPSF